MWSLARAWHYAVRWVLLCARILMLVACGSVAAADPLVNLRQRGKLRVAMDPSFPPFESIVNGQLQGLDVDLALELGKRINVEVVFVQVPYEQIYKALDTREADVIISALYPDGEVTGNYAFSPPYFNAGQLMVVRKDSPIQSHRDMAGQRIGVIRDQEGLLESTRWSYELNPPPQLVVYDTPEQAIAALQAGDVNVLIAHALVAQRARLQDPNLRLLNETVSDEMYVIAARQEDAELLKSIAQIVAQMQSDGTWDRILTRWLVP